MCLLAGIDSGLFLRIPGASGSTSAVRVKMEPGLPGERDKSSPSVVVHDSESGSEVPAAASEASSIDNAALMKQLQESVAKRFLCP